MTRGSFSNLCVTSSTCQLILQPFWRFTYVTAHFLTLPLLYLRHSSFSNSSFAFPTSEALLILQIFLHFTYVTAHSPTLPSLYLRHSSFSNTSVASPTSQLIFQPFFRFSYVTGSAHSPTFPSLHLTSQPILQTFRHFTYVTAHFPTLPTLCLSHSSFSNPSVASPTTQLILQNFFRFSYARGSSLMSPGEPPMLSRA